MMILDVLKFSSSLFLGLSLKRRRCDGGKHNFLERLLGVAHLLSEVSLFSFSLLVVLHLKQFALVRKITHGIGLPNSAYHEDCLLEFTGINNFNSSPAFK